MYTICMYLHTYTLVSVYTICIYINIYVFIYMCVCICMYVYIVDVKLECFLSWRDVGCFFFPLQAWRVILNRSANQPHWLAHKWFNLKHRMLFWCLARLWKLPESQMTQPLHLPALHSLSLSFFFKEYVRFCSHIRLQHLWLVCLSAAPPCKFTDCTFSGADVGL